MTDSRELEAAIEASILDIFGLRASFEPERLPGARRLALGGGCRPLFVRTDDLAGLAMVRRFALHELESQSALLRTKGRLANLTAKTSRLLPAGELGHSAIAAWSLEEADLPLLERFEAWAVAVGQTVVRSCGLDPEDARTTLRVLERETERSISVRGGELYGVQADETSVIVRSEAPLEAVDRELIALQVTWIQRMRVEQDNLRRLDRLRGELATKNEALAQALEDARAAAAARSTFLAHMSHEIRTPLNGIMGVAQLLQDGVGTHEQDELIEVQLESCRWLREVIDAVLDLSKLEAGSMQLDVGPFDVHELVHAAVRGLGTQVDERGATLEVSIPPDMPRYVEGDALRVRQALLNLLSNAIKFTVAADASSLRDSGSAAPRPAVSGLRPADTGFSAAGHIRVELRAEGADIVRFLVHDEGIGVPADRREAIFEPFEQASASTSHHFGGTGLGLPLVRRFARLHGGDAGVEPRAVKGSTFWFTAELPIASGPDSVQVNVVLDEAPKMRVLLVEDQPVNQMVVRRMLEHAGHAVDVVDDGAGAIARVRAGERYDLVLMDRMMPGVDGLEATRQIRKLPGGVDLPIFALTASVTPEETAACLRSGMDRVLAKPLQRDELVAALQEASQWSSDAPPRAAAPSCPTREDGSQLSH